MSITSLSQAKNTIRELGPVLSDFVSFREYFIHNSSDMIRLNSVLDYLMNELPSARGEIRLHKRKIESLVNENINLEKVRQAAFNKWIRVGGREAEEDQLEWNSRVIENHSVFTTTTSNLFDYLLAEI